MTDTPDTAPDMQTNDDEQSGFTWRAFTIGILFTILIAWVVPYNQIILNSSGLATRAFPMGAAILLLLSVFIGNLLMKKVLPAIALKAREILVIFIMTLIACVFPGIGLMMYMGTIAGPAQYGTSSNRYFDTLFKEVDAIKVKGPEDEELRYMTAEELEQVKDFYTEAGGKDAEALAYYHTTDTGDAKPIKLKDFENYKALLASMVHAKWDAAVPFDTVEAKSIQGPTSELNYMFKGFPPRYSGPTWGKIVMDIWFGPLMMWTVFLLAICIMVFCIMTILRKQWIDKERLLFPITRVPLELVEGLDTKKGNSLLKNRLFWIGILLPVLVALYRLGANYTQLFPDLPKARWWTERGIPAGLPYRGDQSISFTTLSVVLAIIGFTYFINLDVAFSIWFFHLLGWAETGEFNYRQFGTAAGGDQYSSGHSYVNHQAMGGVIAMVLVGLWIARRHIKGVFQKAIGKNPPGVDDSDEPMSYRLAVFGLIGAAIFCTVWLIMMGMSWWAAIIFLALSMIIYIGATRVVCEGGIIFVQACMLPQTFMLRTFGSRALGFNNLVIMGLSFLWMADFTSVFMPNLANSMRLTGNASSKRSRWLFPTTLLVIILVFFITGFRTFQLSYNLPVRSGSYKWYFESHPKIGCEYAVRPIDELNKEDTRAEETTVWYNEATAKWPFDNFKYEDEEKNTFSRSAMAKYYNDIKLEQKGKFSIQPLRWVFTIIGFIIMAFLMMMRNRFVWWPLHPVGFPFATAPSIMRTWFSIFIGWLIKLLIIKYGGAKLFNHLKPVFLGLIVGSVIGVAIGLGSDIVMYMMEKITSGVGLMG
ncbi:DUF6785 family protein [Planctomycetota bacterium]